MPKYKSKSSLQYKQSKVARKRDVAKGVKTISNLEYWDFEDYYNIEIIVREILKYQERKKYEKIWDLERSIKNFLHYIHEKLKEWGGYAPDIYGTIVQDFLMYDEARRKMEKEGIELSEEEIESYADDLFARKLKEMNRRELIFFFERVRDAIHHSGSLLEHIYNITNPEFFDYLNDLGGTLSHPRSFGSFKEWKEWNKEQH